VDEIQPADPLRALLIVQSAAPPAIILQADHGGLETNAQDRIRLSKRLTRVVNNLGVTQLRGKSGVFGRA
jgi:hypothetical protein